MRPSVKALALTAAILSGGCILFAGIVNLIWSGYGVAFMDIAGSIYPVYSTTGFGAVFVGTPCGARDGAICGALVAWRYNLLCADALGADSPGVAA